MFFLNKKFIVFLFLFPMLGFAQTPRSKPSTTRILFIFDESRSMLGQWNGARKIDIANRVLSDMVDSLDQIPHVQLAMRMYGNRKDYPPKRCDDTQLVVPFGKDAAKKIKYTLKTTKPRGTTPIAFSLIKCAKDFPPCDNCKNIVILITDGIEECGGDPCEVALNLRQNNVILRPYIIGLGLDVELKNAFDCMGQYFDAGSESDFRKIIKTIISQTTLRTTLQVNLLDSYGKPTETNVNMTFYDSETGTMKYNYIHTINNLGNSDTVEVDALSDYKIIINTIPQVVIDNIHLKPGRHNIVTTPAPQGYLYIKQTTGNKYAHLKIIIKKAVDCNIINYQLIDTKEKYLTGKYDIEIPTIPPLAYKNFKIEQSKTSTITIPQPGQTSIMIPAHGFGSLYQIKKGKAIWLLNLNNGDVLIPLLSGNYMAVWRPAKMKRTYYSKIKKFSVKAGYSTYVKF